jgi:uncharacterized protein with HEPN domain
MKSGRDYSDAFREILAEARLIGQFIAGVEYDAFANNPEKIRAVLHSLLIIGEAVKTVPQSIKSRYAKVPWREVAGMRDRLIHGYFNVDLKRVWLTARDDVPPLRSTVERMLADTQKKGTGE